MSGEARGSLEENEGEVMSWTDGLKKGPKVVGILKCIIGMGVPGCSLVQLTHFQKHSGSLWTQAK